MNENMNNDDLGALDLPDYLTRTAEETLSGNVDGVPMPAPMPAPPADQSGAAPEPMPQQQPPAKDKFSRYRLGTMLDGIRQRFEEGDKEPPIHTSSAQLDDALLGGLRAGLYVLIAPPSFGKSAFAEQIADTAAAAGRNVLYFSLEMSADELVARSISREMYLHDEFMAKSYQQIRIGMKNWKTAERDAFSAAFERYAGYARDRLHIIEDVGTLDGLLETVSDFMQQTPNQPPPLIILDYLQVLRPPADAKSTVEGLDIMARELKQLSMRFKAPLLVLSATNRDAARQSNSRDGGLSSGRGSGAIEFNADVQMVMGWAESGSGNENELRSSETRKIKIDMPKNRAGISGKTLYYNYFPACNYFYDGEAPQSLEKFGTVGDVQRVKQVKQSRKKYTAAPPAKGKDDDEWVIK